MKNFVFTLGVFCALFFSPLFLFSQIDVEGKVKDQSNNRANNKVDEGINNGIDAVESGVKNLFKKKEKKAKTESEEEANNTDSQSQSSTSTKNSSNQASLQSYSKFDFIAGEKVIFYDDFSQDAVGDFPALWNTNGSAEVVKTNLYQGNWVRFIGSGAIWTDELLNLPENYTIEYDAIPIKGEEEGMAGYSFRLIQSINLKSYDHGAIPGKAGFSYGVEYYGRPNYRAYINEVLGEFTDQDGVKDDEALYQKENQKYHISVWVQKSRVRVYQNEVKVFDVPRAFSNPKVKMDRIRFEEGAAMISNVRIAVGNPDMRSKLITDGKLVSYGIYFDVNKDVVKPESYGTLKEIAQVLIDNPTVRVKIVGHTDSDGADVANLDLSKRRGASVKNELVKTFGIDAGRLESDGMGESKPIVTNDSPANKALNRRVEFIKL